MHIEPDIIERLLTDRALGETHADVDALLDAYLATDPQAAAARASIDDTVALADAALTDDVAVTPPPLDASRVNTALQLRRARRYLLNAAVLAAVLVLGFIYGSTRTVPEHPRFNPTPVIAQPAPADGPSRFWSAQRIAALAEQRTERPRRNKWTWTSLTDQTAYREVLQ